MSGPLRISQIQSEYLLPINEIASDIINATYFEFLDNN